MIWRPFPIKHWMSRTRFYKIYENLSNRSSKKYYTCYANKWIKKIWKSFEEFKDDMYESYLDHVEKFWEKETTIDRINNDWNYCKENCRRATQHIQQRNKSNNIIYNIDWVDLCLEDIAIKYWIKKWTLCQRLLYWWDIKSAINNTINIKCRSKNTKQYKEIILSMRSEWNTLSQIWNRLWISLSSIWRFIQKHNK